MPVKLNFALAFADRVRHDEIDLNAFGATGPGQTVLRDAITDYLAYLEANHFVDFAGLERLLLEFLQQNRLHRVTDSLQAVLVDEFQDTNSLQERIYFELCAHSGASLTVEGVRVVFSRKGHSADHVIERIAYAAGEAGDAITVATSDRTQRDLVRGMGGAVIDGPELERRVVDAEREMGRRVEKYAR